MLRVFLFIFRLHSDEIIAKMQYQLINEPPFGGANVEAGMMEALRQFEVLVQSEEDRPCNNVSHTLPQAIKCRVLLRLYVREKRQRPLCSLGHCFFVCPTEREKIPPFACR